MARRILSFFRMLAVWSLLHAASGAAASEVDEHFEKHVRPLLIERCFKCHSADMSKAGLRLDSRDGILHGGKSGPAVNLERPEESVLLVAVRQQTNLKMPPDGKLSDAQIDALAVWIKSGAVFPNGAATAGKQTAQADIQYVPPLAPNEGELSKSLQMWLRADALSVNDAEPVHVWPDQSGHGRDVAATRGIRTGGVGMPARFAARSTLMGRPAVRFDPASGLASSPGNPIEIRGDAGLTIVLVVNLLPHESQPPYDGIFCVGNPASPADPGKPVAALVQINRAEDHALHFAGGWNHDASLGSGSFKPHYGKPTLLTVVKRPGPMKQTTSLHINGVPATRPNGEPLEGRDTIPDIQHRDDIGAYLGKAQEWCGSIQGDVGEVIVYNVPLGDEPRRGVESYLAEKYGLLLDADRNLAQPETFTQQEQAYWAFQGIQDPPPPQVANEAWCKTPLDRFILHAHEERKLQAAPPVDKRTLLRRVTFDLTGLPPTPEEVDDFLQDNGPEAYERVVNRLLSSPHYGERWGRHWLDVVRYAETTANDANAVMGFAWRYRNYVIDAFNSDLPYDQFLIEQLAGDLLPPSGDVAVDTRRIIATGYLMVGSKALAETDKEQSRLDIVDDQIDVTGRAMLGLTLACARCHDHKFDAIRTTDYYALAGIFRSTEPFADEVRNATMWWEFPVPQGEGKEPITVMAPKEALPKNLRVHERGSRFTLGKIVPRGVLQVLNQAGEHGEQAAPRVIDPAQHTSGRLELARWIARGGNPLTARVMVNRIWQHHFGRGLVPTGDNFGTRGQAPSHPELLDWLAARFIESGWSIKAMHRLIVLSNTYQQGEAASGPALQADPDHEWRTAFARRRLSAEEIRDAMLATSGRLDRTLGSGESGEILFERAENINAKIRPNRMAADDPYYTQFTKRTIYLPVVRNMLPDVLALFDAADPNAVTANRNDTTVASQSLFLLNSPFVRDQARSFAERLLADPTLPDPGRIVMAHRLAFGREPSPAELDEASTFLKDYLSSSASQGKNEADRRLAAWQSYCQSLLCSNEFLYVE